MIDSIVDMTIRQYDEWLDACSVIHLSVDVDEGGIVFSEGNKITLNGTLVLGGSDIHYE